MLTVCALVLSHDEALGQLIASHSHAPIEPKIRNPRQNEPAPDQTSSRGRYLPDHTEPIRWTTHYVGSLFELLTPILMPTCATTLLGQRRPGPSPKSVAPGKLLFF
ncbi:hypothetical protein E4T56_gene5167 [Termitomyces sp. T112]|nr:hypothetical protein E4T56_gene5167 [Termitomyces sp. T112]